MPVITPMTQKTKSVLVFIIFLIINFSALGIGSYLMNDGPRLDWYQNLNRAPWEPPGWFFGVAWTTIMILFSFFMMYLWDSGVNKKKVAVLFLIQFVLNVSWNPIFFASQEFLFGLITISLLTVLIGYFLFGFWNALKVKGLFVLPYFVWLVVATSLNAYILLMN